MAHSHIHTWLQGEYHSFDYEYVYMCVCVCVCVNIYASLLSHVQLFVTSWTVAHQALLSMGIFQERILQWVSMLFSRGSSQVGDWTQVSCIAGGFFTNWTTGEAIYMCVCVYIWRESGQSCLHKSDIFHWKSWWVHNRFSLIKRKVHIDIGKFCYISGHIQ